MTKEEKKRKAILKNQNEWIKSNYDRVSITLPKGTKDRIKATNNSINSFICDLVLAELDRIEQ